MSKVKNLPNNFCNKFVESKQCDDEMEKVHNSKPF